jgi:hypothetical protein
MKKLEQTRLQRLWMQFKSWIKPTKLDLVNELRGIDMFELPECDYKELPGKKFEPFKMTMNRNEFDKDIIYQDSSFTRIKIIEPPKYKRFLFFWKRRWEYTVEPYKE